MISLVVALLATCCSLGQAQGDGWADFKALTDPLKADDGVVVLPYERYSELTDHPAVRFAFVEFYAPWCPHCQKLAPKLAEFNKLVAADPSLEGVFVAKVDVDEDKKIKSLFNVQSFPTLFTIFGPRRVEVYRGARETNAMLEHVRKTLTPLKWTMNYVEYATNPYFERPSDRYVLAFVDSMASPAGRMVQKLADSLEKVIQIGVGLNTPKTNGLYGKIMLMSGSAVRHLGPPQHVTTDLEPLDFKRLTDWIVDNMAPTVYMYEPNLGEEIFKVAKLNCLVFVRPPPASPSNMERATQVVEEDGIKKIVHVDRPRLVDASIQDAVVEVAKAQKDPLIQHTIIPVAEKEENALLAKVLKDYVVDQEVSFPFAVLVKKIRHRFHQGAEVEMFPLPLEQSEQLGLSETAKFTAEGLAHYEKMFLEDKLPKVAKTEDPDSSELVKSLSHLQHLTADNFEEAVINSGKDAVVALYKDNCKHCGRADRDNSVEGLMQRSCIDCMYQDQQKIVQNYDRYIEKFNNISASFQNIPTVEFFAINVANNTLSHPTSFGMETFYHWTVSFFMFPANDKMNPKRAPWPGSFLDKWIEQELSIPADDERREEVLSDCEGSQKKAAEAEALKNMANPSEQAAKVPQASEVQAGEKAEGKDEL